MSGQTYDISHPVTEVLLEFIAVFWIFVNFLIKRPKFCSMCVSCTPEIVTNVIALNSELSLLICIKQQTNN